MTGLKGDQAPKCHMLWVYGDLGRLEAAAMSSFIRHGYQLTLWTYGEIGNVPEGVTLKDGREILEEDQIFLNSQGSYAGFSDLFRYAVLSDRGGLYSDTDVFAIKDARYLPSDPFVVSERMKDGGIKINGNLLHNPKPEMGNVVDLALAYASRFPKNMVYWSELGPNLLTAICRIHPKHGFSVLSPEFSNPINYWESPNLFLARTPTPSGSVVHLYKEMWRRWGYTEATALPPDSLIGNLLRHGAA